MIKKKFDCSECGSLGTIVVLGEDHQLEDIVYCPLCSGDIYSEQEVEDDS